MARLAATSLITRNMLRADPLARIAARLRGHPSKVLARCCGCSPRAADNWKGAACAPRLPELISLAAAYPDIQDELNQLIEEARQWPDAA